MYTATQCRQIYNRYFPERAKRYRHWYCLKKVHTPAPGVRNIYVYFNGHILVGCDGDSVEILQWFRKERDLNNPKKQNSIAVSKRTIDIHKMWNKGYSVYKIAKTLELNPGSVDYHLKKTLDKDTVS